MSLRKHTHGALWFPLHSQLRTLVSNGGGGEPSYAVDRMVFGIDTTLGDGNAGITLLGRNFGTWSATVHWGDGSTSSITSYNDADLAHTYASGGTYVIEIEGTIGGIYFGASTDAPKVTEVLQMGAVGIQWLASTFAGCTSLHTFTTLPTCDLSAITVSHLGPRLLFQGCTSLVTATFASGMSAPTILHIGEVFSGCSVLTTADLSGFAGAPVADAYRTFFFCSALTTVIGFADMDWTHASGPANLNNCFTLAAGDLDVDLRIDFSGGNFTSATFGFASWGGPTNARYNEALEYWDTAITPPDGFNLGDMGSVVASGAGLTAKTSLETDHTWSITDDT